MKALLKTCLVFGLICGSLSAQAAGLCETKWSDFQAKLKNDSNRLAFTNSSGPMNIGLCWWHSRMQRNANYLLDFKSGSKRMSREQALTVVKNLSRTNKVQVVNGYKNLSEFSSEYSAEMTEVLGQWQLSDSFLKFNWLSGIGSSSVTSKGLSDNMDSLYKEVTQKKNVVYQMLKMPGLEAHAWLVLDMKKISNGYQLTIVDSNFSDLQTYIYQRGMTEFDYLVWGSPNHDMHFTPNTQRESDFADYTSAIRASCK